MTIKTNSNRPKEPRKTLPASIRKEVLLEAGYRCANPICNFPLIHVHHIVYVQYGGEDSIDNLIALCGNCHPMVHNGTISEDSIRVWKQMIVIANEAWSKDTLNNLLFLDTPLANNLFLTGDGIVKFSDLIVSGLAIAEHQDFHYFNREKAEEQIIKIDLPQPDILSIAPASELAKQAFVIRLTERGKRLVKAWKEGSLKKLDAALIDGK